MGLCLCRLSGPLLLVALLGCAATSGVPARQNAKAHYLLGVSALGENDPTQALQEFLQAEAADDSDADIQDGLAQAYLQKRAYDLAEQHFLRAIALSKGAPRHYNNLGSLYLTMERYDEAVTALRKAADNLLFATPENAWTGIGRAYVLKRDYPAAEQAYLKARELNPRYPQVHLLLGELYYNQGRTAEAVAVFRQLNALAPRSAVARYWLALGYLQARQNALARQAFEETVQLAPDSEQARLARGHLKSLR